MYIIYVFVYNMKVNNFWQSMFQIQLFSHKTKTLAVYVINFFAINLKFYVIHIIITFFFITKSKKFWNMFQVWLLL